ncbi:MAG: hypothetical protein ACPL6C_03730, partial [bacterium]
HFHPPEVGVRGVYRFIMRSMHPHKQANEVSAQVEGVRRSLKLGGGEASGSEPTLLPAVRVGFLPPPDCQLQSIWVYCNFAVLL